MIGELQTITFSADRWIYLDALNMPPIMIYDQEVSCAVEIVTGIRTVLSSL